MMYYLTFDLCLYDWPKNNSWIKQINIGETQNERSMVIPHIYLFKKWKNVYVRTFAWIIKYIKYNHPMETDFSFEINDKKCMDIWSGAICRDNI